MSILGRHSYYTTTALVLPKQQHSARRHPHYPQHYQHGKSRVNYYHVVVALSGGVDSSVAAALLKQQLDANSSSSSHHEPSLAPEADTACSSSSGMTSLSGLHMSNWNSNNVYDDDSIPRVCPTAEQDWQDAAAVARHLDLPMQRLQHLEATYWTAVFQPYVSRIVDHQEIGNPDVHCNRYIKFGALLQYCRQQYGPDTRLATGHYARLWHRDDSKVPDCVEQALQEDTTGTADWIRTWGGGHTQSDSSSNRLPPILLAAADRSKDQSYFLAACPGDSLTNVLFPLGDYYKKKKSNHENKSVRQLAAELQLPTAHKRDSMGICFVGKRRGTGAFRDFLQPYLPAATTPVNFVDVDTGQQVGTTAPEPAHAALYAVGQGAKLSGTPEKYFCVGTTTTLTRTATSRTNRLLQFQPDQNNNNNAQIVWVCAGTHHPALYADTLQVDHVHWMASNEPPLPLLQAASSNGSSSGVWRTQCRIRHLQPLMDCTVQLIHQKASTTAAAATGSTPPSSSSSTTATPQPLYVLHVTFDKPVRAIAPGQQIVFYGLNGLVCWGGGPIARTGPTYWEQERDLPDQVNPSSHNDTSSNSSMSSSSSWSSSSSSS